MDKEGVNRIKVSIITVSYNSADTIEKTIQSVLEQSYQNIEYIIIDGSSTDGTQQIIEKYTDRIACYISEKDDGLYYAMNKGIQKATGDIIGIINSDDWYAQNVIQDVVDYYLQNEVDLIYGKIINVLSDNSEKESWQIPLDHMWYEMTVPHPSVFVKKKVYDLLGVFNVEYKLAADYELLLRFYSEKVIFGYLDKVIVYFRSGGVSETRRKESIGEVYDISLSYVDKSPDIGHIRQKIDEGRQWAYFVESVKEDNRLVYRLLCRYFHTKIDKLIIFGIGYWGKYCYKILTDNGICILSVADNDKSKWGDNYNEHKIVSSGQLQSMNAYVLIAMKENGEQIKQQLENDLKPGLKCVCLKELAVLCLKDYGISKR